VKTGDGLLGCRGGGGGGGGLINIVFFMENRVISCLFPYIRYNASDKGWVNFVGIPAQGGGN